MSRKEEFLKGIGAANKDGKNWKKINTPNSKRTQLLKDIVYFADAWEAE